MEFACRLAQLAAIGLLAIGVSGLLAAALGALFGKQFVAGDAPGVMYTAERCAEFLRGYPAITDCTQAAIEHHFDETVAYRLAAGVLGLAGLAVTVPIVRRYRRCTRAFVAPRNLTNAAGAALFGFAAAVLLLLGGSGAALGVGNAGALLSGGLIALPLFGWYAAAVLGILRGEVSIDERT